MDRTQHERFRSRAIQQWNDGFDLLVNSPRTDISLANGLAGYLMLECGLHKHAPDAGHADRIALLLARIVASLESKKERIGLWTGLLGPLYAFEYLRRNDAKLVNDEIVEFIGSMDDILVAACADATSHLHYDLIGGLCGMGAYALMRTDKIAGMKIYAAVERELFSRATRSDGGLTWITPSKFAGVGLKDAVGLVDFGVAHGVAGVIGLAAGAMQAGLGTDRSGELLTAAIANLRTQVMDAASPSSFPSTNLDATRYSRLAWCYGDLGIGAALLYAAEALDDGAGRQFAIGVLRKRFSSSNDQFMLQDSALCHGHAGVWRIAQRIARRSAVDVIQQVAGRSLATIVAADLPTQVHDNFAGFLDGHSGILMALITEDEHEEAPWDICMNFGF